MSLKVEILGLKSTISFDSKKTIDSKRKNKILEMYDDGYKFDKIKESLAFYKSEYLKGYYDCFGATIEDEKIDDLIKKIRSVCNIFGITLNKSENEYYLELIAIIKSEKASESLVNQTEMINEVVGSDKLLIKSLEYFDIIEEEGEEEEEEEVGAFIGLSISRDGLKVKMSIDFNDINELKNIYIAMENYITTVLLPKLEKEGQ